jgi:hypothetical protein
MAGTYGSGGYGTTNPGSSFIALEQIVSSTALTPALVVNGDVAIGSYNGSVNVQTYSTPSQNTTSSEIITHDLSFSASKNTDNLYPIRLRAALPVGTFSGDGLDFVIANSATNNNWTPTERIRVISGVGQGSRPYPGGSVVIGGVTGPSSSSLYVNGQAVCSAGLTVGGGTIAGAGLTVSNGATISTSGTGPALTVNGIISATDVIATSDVRTKENIVTIDSALDKVLKMRGVYFNKKNDQQRRVGVIAQETEEVLPEVVFTDDSDDKNKSVAYGNIVGLLIEAIKEQQVIIERLM